MARRAWPDRKEYLSIRVDHKAPPDRPQESIHLEFPKDQCVACIGEDLPERLLAGFGIRMASISAAAKVKKMMALTPLLETQQANVYLVGDLLSQAYLETVDFAAPPETYRRIKHRGNRETAQCSLFVRLMSGKATRLWGQKADTIPSFLRMGPGSAL